MRNRRTLLGFVTPKRSLNRVPSPILALGLPMASIMFASMTPTWPFIASAPLLPPFGLLLLIAWRQVRPGVLPIWSGLLLGLFDDLFSGQPFGSAAMLWSITMILLELVEMQFPWRNFLVDWGMAAGIVIGYIIVCMFIAKSHTGVPSLSAVLPQIALSVLIYPLVGRFVARLDRMRLLPVVELG